MLTTLYSIYDIINCYLARESLTLDTFFKHNEKHCQFFLPQVEITILKDQLYEKPVESHNFPNDIVSFIKIFRIKIKITIIRIYYI